MKKPIVAFLLATALAAGQALAAEAPTPPANGFYGGIALRDSGAESTGVAFGTMGSAWTRFGATSADDSGSRTLLYGGYRWRNDLAVEAAFESNEGYALRPADAPGRSGVGLALPGLVDSTSRTWNVDVYGSWSVLRSLSLYGRLGYAQSDAAPGYATTGLPTDPRRARDGVNYGVGLRYDVTSAFGLKLEYARFARFPGEALGNGLPESDQVQIGVQYRF